MHFIDQSVDLAVLVKAGSGTEEGQHRSIGVEIVRIAIIWPIKINSHKQNLSAEVVLSLADNLENMKVLTAIALVALVTSIATMTTTSALDTVEIRGPVAEIKDGWSYSWGPQDFAGFYYDIDDDLGAETITMTIKGDVLEENTMPKGIVYRTDAQETDFEFGDWGRYYTIAFLKELYFAGYIEMTEDREVGYLYQITEDTKLMAEEQLSKVLMDDDKKRTITTDTPLKLMEGYELIIESIDLEGDKVHLELYKDGELVDSSVVEPSAKGAGMAEKTYTYTKDLGDSEDIVVIAVHFRNAFRGTDQDMATVDGIWQISDAYIEIEEDTEYDKMTIQDVDPSNGNMFIEMDNEDNKITLNKDEDIKLMGNFWVRTADQDLINASHPLRFYIYEEISEPGTYEIRGEVAEVVDNTGTAPYVWDHSNFAGFYYDIDEDLGSERISMTINENVLSDEADPISGRRGVVYETEAQEDQFEFEDWGEYWTIGFLGVEYFAAYVDDPRYFLCDKSDDSNLMVDEQLSRVLIDEDEERTFAIGTPLELEEGYKLAISAVDLDGDKVYVELMREGVSVETAVVQPSKENASLEDETYVYSKNLGGTEDIVVIAVHFKNAFRGTELDMVTVDGVWQISEMPIPVKDGTEYGKMTIQTVDSSAPMKIMMNNEDNSITLGKDRYINLMENIRIKTSDQDDVSARNPLRFYIYEEAIIKGDDVDRAALGSLVEE